MWYANCCLKKFLSIWKQCWHYFSLNPHTHQNKPNDDIRNESIWMHLKHIWYGMLHSKSCNHYSIKLLPKCLWIWTLEHGCKMVISVFKTWDVNGTELAWGHIKFQPLLNSQVLSSNSCQAVQQSWNACCADHMYLQASQTILIWPWWLIIQNTGKHIYFTANFIHPNF